MTGLSLRLPLVVYAGCQALFLVWLAAFYPGLMSADSVEYVKHVTVGPWVSNHSVLYDALLGASLAITGDLGAVTLAQTAAMSAGLAYVCTGLRALGIRGWWSAPFALAVPLVPSLGGFVVTLWKDVPFAICAVFLVGTIARILAGRRSVASFAVLAAELLGLVLFRSNGVLMVLAVVLLLVIVVRGVRLPVLAAGGMAIAGLVAAFLIYSLAGIAPARATHTFATAYADVAVAYRAAPEEFTTADLALLERMARLDFWREAGGSCYSVNQLLYSPRFDRVQADRLGPEVRSLWIRLVRNRPLAATHTWLCRGSIAWNPLSGPPELRATPYKFDLPIRAENQISPVTRTRPLSTRLYRVAAGYLTASVDLEPLLWRGATWCYVAYLAVGLFAWRRGDPQLIALAAVSAGQQLGVAAVIAAQDFRYMAGPIFIGIMLLPLVIGAFRGARTVKP